MSEPVTIIAGVSTIVNNIWKDSEDLYQFFNGIIDAPKHMLAISMMCEDCT
jgi:hypothetical protein